MKMVACKGLLLLACCATSLHLTKARYWGSPENDYSPENYYSHENDNSMEQQSCGWPSMQHRRFPRMAKNWKYEKHYAYANYIQDMTTCEKNTWNFDSQFAADLPMNEKARLHSIRNRWDQRRNIVFMDPEDLGVITHEGKQYWKFKSANVFICTKSVPTSFFDSCTDAPAPLGWKNTEQYLRILDGHWDDRGLPPYI